ncbi:hypothetical protein K449DRAFT_66273 [Hypoxylon sp. EC38]|nr:hypothetical protein K449DRAFT_66273 [Hypoxylon sp. EC38]
MQDRSEANISLPSFQPLISTQMRIRPQPASVLLNQGSCPSTFISCQVRRETPIQYTWCILCAPYDRDFLAPVDLVEARTVIMVTSPLVENTRFPLFGPSDTPLPTHWKRKYCTNTCRIAGMSYSGLCIMRVTRPRYLWAYPRRQLFQDGKQLTCVLYSILLFPCLKTGLGWTTVRYGGWARTSRMLKNSNVRSTSGLNAWHSTNIQTT